MKFTCQKENEVYTSNFAKHKIIIRVYCIMLIIKWSIKYAQVKFLVSRNILNKHCLTCNKYFYILKYSNLAHPTNTSKIQIVWELFSVNKFKPEKGRRNDGIKLYANPTNRSITQIPRQESLNSKFIWNQIEIAQHASLPNKWKHERFAHCQQP